MLELVKEAKLSWFRNIDSEGLCESYVPGCERDPRFNVEIPVINIIIKGYFDDDFDDGERRLRRTINHLPEYLDTLAHEMLHAFFSIYTCDWNNCYNELEDPCRGHDIFCQAAAYAIEKVDRGVFLGLALDLNRCVSLAIDIQMGYNMPNAATLRSLNLNIVELWENVRELRDHVASQGQKESKFYRL
jgi:hypothetical protein